MVSKGRGLLVTAEDTLTYPLRVSGDDKIATRMLGICWMTLAGEWPLDEA